MPATLERSRSTGMADAGPFPESEFLTIEGVTVFAEHVTRTPKGRPLRFGPAELQMVAKRCNQRIADTGDYAVICVGHTPSEEARANGVLSPPAEGFASNFRLGQEQDSRGNVRYLILCDFHLFREFAPNYKRYPRRSAELWIEDRYEDMFLDPIALLGSEPPRLDMGNLYSRFCKSDGREVLKYSYTMAGAGPASTFIPSHGERKRLEAEEDDMADTQEIVNSVIDAISQLPEIKYIQSMMEKEQGAGDTSGLDNSAPGEQEQLGELAVAPPAAPEAPLATTPAEAAAVPVEAPAAPPAADPAPAAPAAPEAPPAAPAGDEVLDPAEREKMQRYSALDEATADMDDDDFEQYAARRRKRRKGYSAEEGDDAVVEQYARTGETLHYEKRLKDAEAALLEERGLRIDGQRKHALERLRTSGYQLDVAEEMERLNYSLVQSPEKFRDELSRIAKNYNRFPSAVELPEIDMLLDTAPTDEPMRYSAAEQERLTKATTAEVLRRRKKGENVDYDDVKAELAGKR